MYETKEGKGSSKVASGVPAHKTGHMEHKKHTHDGNESYKPGSAGKIGLYLKNMGRSNGY